MAISEITRIAILDDLALSPHQWAGRLEEPDFLSRFCRLTELPSYDHRFRDAYGDIYQHRVNNLDWDDDWVFTDPRFGLADNDEALLRFLAETLHPRVRKTHGDALALAELYNKHLRPDGWELREVSRISGRPVFAPRPLLTVPVAVEKIRVRAGDLGYLHEQMLRMGAAERDPALAIGAAKELLETCCKTILEEAGLVADPRWDLPRLLKETTKRLRVTPEHIAADARGAASSRQVLGSLGAVVAGLAELRNEYGTGHGRAADHAGLQARHARLVWRSVRRRQSRSSCLRRSITEASKPTARSPRSRRVVRRNSAIAVLRAGTGRYQPTLEHACDQGFRWRNLVSDGGDRRGWRR